MSPAIVKNSFLEEENSPFKSDPNFQQIVTLIQKEDLVIFVGSGLSMGIYENWPKLVGRLCAECGVSTTAVDLDKADTPTLLSYSQKAKDAALSTYTKTLKEIYQYETRTRKAYGTLTNLNATAFMTLNFDTLLHDSLVQHYPDASRFSLAYSHAKIRDRNLFHIHGIATEIDTKGIVLTEHEYNEAYETDSDLQRFLRDLFSQYNILFVGCGLEDPPFKKLFEEVIQMRAALALKDTELSNELYILQPTIMVKGNRDPDKEYEEAKQFTDKGIQAVYYDPINKTHAGLDQALHNLYQEVIKQPSRSGTYDPTGGTICP